MSFASLLIRLFATHKPELLADRIASRSRQRVWDRVSHRMYALTGAEARGYVRARAAAIVEEETDRLIAEEGGKAAQQRMRILRDAGDSVIRLVLEQAQISRQTPQPLRRAA